MIDDDRFNVGAQPEVLLSDQEVVAQFHADPETGPQLMGRFLDILGYADQAGTQLYDRNGQPISIDGLSLMKRDYLRIAGRHPGAVEAISGFVGAGEQGRTDQDVDAFRSMVGYFMGLGQAPAAPES